MSSNRIVYAMGVDPGGTTGIAVIGVRENTVYRPNPGNIEVHDTYSMTGGATEQVLELFHIAAQYWPLAIALESFTPRKPITSEEYLAPVRIGSRIQFCIDTHYSLAKLFYQSPGDAMHTAPDDRLKLWGLYTPGPDHIKDATRHAIMFIRRAKVSEPLRTKAWGPYSQDHTNARNGRRTARRTLY